MGPVPTSQGVVILGTKEILLELTKSPCAYLPTATHLGYFYSFIFDLTSEFATHSLIVTHSADLPLIFEEMPLILMIFATHFHSYRLRGCEIEAHPEYLGFQITHFEKFWLASM